MKITRPRLTFASRILSGYLLVFGVASWVFYDSLIEEIKPVVRQAAESAMIDTANILAEAVAEDVAKRNFAPLETMAEQVFQRQLAAVVWEHLRTQVILNFYITDDQGIVLFSSENKDVGADYSQWRDVYLTLRGRYGARSSLANAYDPKSTVMHVAAPIFYNEQLIGVLTVYNPNNTMQPFIEVSRKKVLAKWMLVLFFSGLMATVLSIWLSRSIARLANYAKHVQQGKPAQVPELLGSELKQLGKAIEDMRIKLEGKAYIEQYVQSLTHELKSPLAAIRGAAEMLEEDLPVDIKKKFLGNIREQNARMQCSIDQLLRLASLENQTQIAEKNAVLASQLASAVIEQLSSKAELKAIVIECQVVNNFFVSGDQSLLQLALNNILDNALDFSPSNGSVLVVVDSPGIYVIDHGAGIPEYALPKVGNRFFSLPRPDGRPKSTGLGLALSREICRMHCAQLSIENMPQTGAKIGLIF